MQFGKTLVGAIIGGALGIGLLVVVYLQYGIDKMWMAIPVALLTGLGVRIMVARGGHASYLRGAITVLFALAAYLGGLQISKAIATQRAADVAKAGARAGIEQPAAEPGATKNPEAEPAADGPAAPNNPPDEAPRSAGEAMSRTVMPRAFSTWDFLSLAVAALLAYELGRGSGGVPANTAGSDPSKSVPAGTHPDA